MSAPHENRSAPVTAPRSMLSRWVPQPVLSGLLAIVWLLLVNDLSAGHVLLGVLIGLAIPLITSTYWPDRSIPRRPLLVMEYALVVLWDIVVSNIAVARLVLFHRGDTLRSVFVTVPLDLKSAEAIAVLAGTITMTPGTVTADLSADGSKLLVHCLDTEDPDAVVSDIKQRYERRLKEIFG